MTITAVPGVRVGHWTDPVGLTGVTVVVFPEPNVAAVEVRGAAPGSRETALLEPGMRVETVQAIALSGGSAFGLAAADGVMRELEAAGRGHPTPMGVVPIVPAGVIFDLGIGATVAKWRGPQARRPGGVGSASLAAGEAMVGALCVLNALGDVFTLAGEPLTGGSPEPELAPVAPVPVGNTTLAVVATDARLSRNDLRRVAVRAQDALAACLRPAHTRYDGDAAFVVSCGDRSGDVDAVSEATFIAVARAIQAATVEPESE